MKKKLIISLALFMILNGVTFAQSEISAADAQRYSAYYSNGMEYLKNSQYSSAIAEFKKVLRFSPYDPMVQEALTQAYVARAQYYRQTTKEIKKALVDYKSAAFYAIYWNDKNESAALKQIGSYSQREADSLEKRLGENPADTTSRFQSAKNLKAQGELAAAGYDFQQLKTGTYSKQAYENLGNIYKNLNNFMLAMDYMKTAIDNNPKDARLHFLYGIMLDEAKNYEASMEQYNLALKYGDNSPELLSNLETKWTQNIVNNPNNASSYINLGAIYQKQGNFDAAKAQYNKAILLDPSDETAYNNLASLYISQKNYLGAIETYNKLLARNPKNVQVLRYKAQALYDAQKYDEAIAQYEIISKIDPTSDAQARINDIVDNNFKGEKLLNYLAKKVQTNPQSYENQFNLALELHKNKKYLPALEAYSRAQAINPSKEETYLNMIQILIEQKNYPKAQEICQKGLMVMPNNAAFSQYLNDIKNYDANNQYEMATKLYEQKNYKAALSQYNQIKEKNENVKMAIASCYWEMNDYAAANKIYLEVLSVNPNNKEALANSAYAYYSLKDYDNAKKTAQKLLNIDKNNKAAFDIMNSLKQADIQSVMSEMIAKYDAANYSASLNAANKLLSQEPNSEYGLYYKGLCLDELKKPKDAINTYKQLILKHPEFENAYYSLAVALDGIENYKEAVQNYDKFITITKTKKINNEMTKFALDRTKELKDYLGKVNAK